MLCLALMRCQVKAPCLARLYGQRASGNLSEAIAPVLISMKGFI